MTDIVFDPVTIRNLYETRDWSNPRLKLILRDRGMTTATLAAKIGMNHANLRSATVGRLMPSADQRRRICAVLDVPESTIWPHNGR